MKSTGDFQVFTEVTGDESCASLVEVRGDILCHPSYRWPVVHTVEIHARREQVGIAPKA